MSGEADLAVLRYTAGTALTGYQLGAPVPKLGESVWTATRRDLVRRRRVRAASIPRWSEDTGPSWPVEP